MKALKITLSHGRIWTAETSTGVRTQSSTLEGALRDLLPENLVGAFGFDFDKDAHDPWLGVRVVMDSIRDSGGDGNITQGVKSA